MGQIQSFYGARVENPKLFEKLDAESREGFNKSVIRLYQDIVEFIESSAKMGHRGFRYNKIWTEPGYLMSPIACQSATDDNTTRCTNFVLSHETRQKLLDDVIKILTDEKIVARNPICKTVERDNMSYIEISIDLFLDMVPEPIPSISNEYDFKNSSC